MKLLQWKGTSGCNLPLDFWQTLKDGGKASAFHSSSWCRLVGWNSWTETIGETRLHQCSVFFLSMHHTSSWTLAITPCLYQCWAGTKLWYRNNLVLNRFFCKELVKYHSRCYMGWNQCWAVLRNWLRIVSGFRLVLTLNPVSYHWISYLGWTLSIPFKLRMEHHENLAGSLC